MQLKYLPNAITVSRLFLVPVLILLLKGHHYFAALVVFLVAGVSDALDGFIAKRFDLSSQFGAVLDPLADKVLLVSAYVMLTINGDIPFWLMLTVVFRDLFIVGGYLLVTSVLGAVHMRPSYLSKMNTVAQILLVLAILAQEAMSWSFFGLRDILIYIVAVTTVISGAHYIWLWLVKKQIDTVNKSNE